MFVYLDNSATTRQYDQVTAEMKQAMEELYGNPSSLHSLGLASEKRVRTARQHLADALGAKEEEIVFTSCGTESDNTALYGIAHAKRREGKKIITSKVEHPAVLEACKVLEKEGFIIEYIDVDDKCRLNMEQLQAAIDDETILISIMAVNNEVGTIMPIRNIAKMKGKAVFHTDAVQAFGKIDLRNTGADLISVSAHKIHGPKGIGFLYINEKIKIHPIIWGGGQQKGMRSGTENVPAIAGMALAIETIYKNLDEEIDKLYQLKQRFIDGAMKIEDVKINGLTGRDSAPHVVSLSVRGVRSEVLLHALEDKGIYVSAGSACASNKPSVSATLQAIGVEKDLLDSTIRFSFSVFTTPEEIDYTLQNLYAIIPMLRKYTRH